MENKIVTWEEMAHKMEEVFGAYVDWEEEFFQCPEDEDYVHKEDYPLMNGYVCPICETDFSADFED